MLPEYNSFQHRVAHISTRLGLFAIISYQPYKEMVSPFYRTRTNQAVSPQCFSPQRLVLGVYKEMVSPFNRTRTNQPVSPQCLVLGVYKEIVSPFHTTRTNQPVSPPFFCFVSIYALLSLLFTHIHFRVGLLLHHTILPS